MNKVAIVKIAGFLVVPILVMLIVIYFLYPVLNSDKYDRIVETGGLLNDSTMVDSLAMDSLAMADSLNVSVSDSVVGEQNPDIPNEFWAHQVDSLQRVIYSLTARIEGLQNAKAVDETVAKLEEEAFKDRVKSLLNLEEKELSPILEKMTSKQLVRLYSEAGNTQREKILRSLSSARAAQLITEIML